MNIKLELPKLTDLRPRITVIGVGGAGGNAINNMIASGLQGVDFVVANTDAQALTQSSAEHRIQLGVNLTEGLGAGSRPEIGQAAAEEALDDIRAQISGSHMVFIAAGMGGGTGSGAAGVIARIAKDAGILTVGIVTKPFQFEGARRMRVAEAGITELARFVDTLIVIPNQNLFRIANERTTFAEAFVLADQVLYSGIACIVDLIVKDGLINLDFADVRTVMTGMGTAMMGTGEAAGERRAVVAAEEAITNPLLDDVSLKGARGLLLSIIGGKDMTLYEVDEAASRIREEVDPEANIIVGASFDESMGDRLRVSIVASGMARSGIQMQPQQQAAAAPPAATPAPLRHAPPPLPVAQSYSAAPPAATEAGFAEMFAKAVDPIPTSPAALQAPPQAQMSKPEAPTWHAPGDVRIQQSLPPIGQAQPYRAPAAAGPAAELQQPPHAPAEAFQPRPSQEPASAKPKRMPEVEDFPPVGQREYRARVTAPAAQANPSPRVYQGPVASPPRKPGLFERLTGLARRENESPAQNNAGYPQGGMRAEHAGAAGGRPSPSARSGTEPQRASSKHQQEAELPVFFDRSKQ